MKKIICFDIDGVICKTKKITIQIKTKQKIIKYINSLLKRVVALKFLQLGTWVGSMTIVKKLKLWF